MLPLLTGGYRICIYTISTRHHAARSRAQQHLNNAAMLLSCPLALGEERAFNGLSGRRKRKPALAPFPHGGDALTAADAHGGESAS